MAIALVPMKYWRSFGDPKKPDTKFTGPLPTAV
jgi:hypothetical protein